MPAPFLLDLSHTCHTRARTGIQRVARSLRLALGDHGTGITYDPYRRIWRTLETWELENLESDAASSKRGAQWPLAARWRGRFDRFVGRTGKPLPSASGVLVPEIFSAAIAPRLRDLPRPRIAVFHDAIPLQLPEFSPPKTVARFPAYLQELLEFEGIAAVSEDSGRSLAEYWDWLGVTVRPRIRVIPLGVDSPRPTATEWTSAATTLDPAWPTLLCVGSIEGRKNHAALFEACERLWATGAQFKLEVVGMARPETAAPALARLRELHDRGRPIRHMADADDARVAQAYANARFTVYPSLREGFGLPVLESLAHGKPCICGGHGALGEAARGGGCFTLDRVDAPALADGILRLLTDAPLFAALSAQATARPRRTWSDYARDLRAFFGELRAETAS